MMNATRSLRGVLIAAAVLGVMLSVAASRADARASEPEVRARITAAASGTAAVSQTNSVQNRAAEQAKNEERELSGVVTALDVSSITVDGMRISLKAMTELKTSLKVGDMVKVHALRQADGSYLAREVEKVEPGESHLEHPGSPVGVGGDIGHHPEPEQEVHHSTAADDHGHHAEPGGHHNGHHE